MNANYLFVRGTKLARTRNINLLPPVVLTPQNAASLGIADPSPQQIGREVYGPGRRDPRFDGIYQLENAASSTYHGLSLTLTRRLANEVAFSGSYTLSKTLDDASDFDEQPENPFNLRAERALSRHHQGQRFVFSALFDLPFGEEENGSKKSQPPSAVAELAEKILGQIEVAPIVTIGSGPARFQRMVQIIVADEMTNQMLFGMDLMAGGILRVDLVKGRWSWNLMRLDLSKIGSPSLSPSKSPKSS